MRRKGTVVNNASEEEAHITGQRNVQEKVEFKEVTRDRLRKYHD